MSIFKDFFVKEKPVFTGITRGIAGFGFGASGGGGDTGPVAEPITASGGNQNGITPGNGYKYHTFTSNGTFTVTGSKTMEILMVGGGGGSGPINDSRAGGGGAGGLIYWDSMSVTDGSYTVTVGDGGPGASTGGDGENSIFGPGTPLHLVALGGGAGSAGARNSMSNACLLYTSPSPRDLSTSRMPSSA